MLKKQCQQSNVDNDGNDSNGRDGNGNGNGNGNGDGNGDDAITGNNHGYDVNEDGSGNLRTAIG